MLRDQWQIGQKLTLSLGIRWEYYPVPTRADRGVEFFDLTTNRVLLCGVGNNSETCGVKVEKNLFTPRLGIAYRPYDSLVIRAGLLAQPAERPHVSQRHLHLPGVGHHHERRV